MAILGEEVADAYISVHADTRPFREDVKKLQASTRTLFDKLGDLAGSQFMRAWTKQIRGVSLQSLTNRIRGDLRRLQRTIATDMRIIAATLEDNLVRPVRRSLTRVTNQIIVSVGSAKDAVVQFGQDTAEVFSGQLYNQFLRVRSVIDNVEPSLRGIKNAFLDTAVAAREMVAPGLWDKFLDEVQLFVVHMSVAGRRAVESFKDGFDKAWNNDLMRAVRVWVRDLADVIGSGSSVLFRDLRTFFALGFKMTADDIAESGRRIGSTFDSMWGRVTRRSKRGAQEATDAVQDFVDGAQGALWELAETTEKTTEKNVAVNRQFIGKLKGSRNDFLNIVGSIGGAVERMASKVVDKGLGLIGKGFEELGVALFRFGGSNGQGGPLGGIGQALFDIGGTIGGLAGKGGIVGLVVTVGALSLAFAALGPILAIVSVALSSLLGIVVALTASITFAIAGALLPLGTMALVAAAGVGVLIVALTGLDDKTKKAFEPLKATFKEIQKNVANQLFKNLANQIDGLQEILNKEIAPLLTIAAGALSSVIDYMIAAFQRPEVAATLTKLGESLPAIMTNLGSALTDFGLGLLGFFTAIAPDVEGVSEDLAGIAKDFADWANDKENQDSIREFFKRAKESADILWNVIKEVGKALTTLFNDGKEDGDDLLTKIGEIITKFAEWVNSKEGRKEIADWFANAKTVAGQVATAVGLIGDALVKLDTPENRKALQSILNLVNDILGAVNWLAAAFASLPAVWATIKATAFTIPGLSSVLNVIEDIIAGIKWIANHMPGGGVANSTPSGGGRPPQPMAAGGIVSSPQYLAGEAGREMVVPLVRPLGQVDPSVRAVSAFARGMDPSGIGYPSSNNNGGGKVVNIADGAIRLTVPTDDPEQAANAVLDRLVARWK